MPPLRPSRRLAAIALLGTLLLGGLAFFRPQKECRATPTPVARPEPGAKRASGTPASSGEKSVGSSPAKGISPGGGAPIPVKVIPLAPEAFRTPIPATGTLLPRESVTIVSELSRRLVRIRAEEGKRVTRGTVLFDLDNADLLAERDRLKIQLELARRTATRQEELLHEAVTTEAEADSARSAAGELEAGLRILSVTLEKTQIRAPFDGILGLRRVSEGAWLTPSTPLITISDTSRLKVDFRIPERHARDIRVGDKFTVRVEGLQKTFSAQVKATEPGVDEASRSLLVRGLVDGQEELVPGTFAKIEIPVVIREALLVPAIAVMPGLAGRSVYVERAGKAQLVAVDTGARTPDRVQILTGLSAGDRLIVSNLLRLRDGADVQVSETKP